MISYPWTLYSGGGSQQSTWTRLHANDHEWMRSVGAKLSGEVLSTGHFAFYLDVGVEYDDGEPHEIAEIVSPDGDPYETIATLCKGAKKLLERAKAEG